MPEERGGPGVPFPPPLLFFGFLAAGLALDRFSAFSKPKNPLPLALGTVAIFGGIAIVVGSLEQMKRANTSAMVWKPATTLVTGGFFRYTRNPMYFGVTSIYLGVAMARRSLPAFVMLPIALALADRHIVAKEERHLEARFGDEFRAYETAVPRWF